MSNLITGYKLTVIINPLAVSDTAEDGVLWRREEKVLTLIVGFCLSDLNVEMPQTLIRSYICNFSEESV